MGNILIENGKVIGLSPVPNMTGATALNDGKSGLVPAPQAGDEDKVLKGDGTWGEVASTPAVTKYTLSLVTGLTGYAIKVGKMVHIHVQTPTGSAVGIVNASIICSDLPLDIRRPTNTGYTKCGVACSRVPVQIGQDYYFPIYASTHGANLAIANDYGATMYYLGFDFTYYIE